MIDEAKEDFKYLKQKIDNTPFKMNMQILANRAFLLHTSLFLFFSHKSSEGDYDALIDFYANEKFFLNILFFSIITNYIFYISYLNTIQMICPHLIRYLAAALILSKNSQKYGSFNLNSFVNLLQKETCEYTDNLIEFIRSALINFNFQHAQTLIKKIKNDFEHDFFLAAKADAIIHNLQTILFEEYCKIYRFIEIRYFFF